ncbi:hypothetical protein [Engelhardtia mirabilis]|uniref:Uncharacterized protein n=1 Tax=Engelhardtia mirabilis TaxID=2528011 RepID=A0A518BGB1_9BACT|nr:hypothetical protein Pla133_10800 [Planctomycetes bacterium Pla133]QDV00341.1 hypothetical protein Pla86_10800 [Planctomycetes bacterium Pla86]
MTRSARRRWTADLESEIDGLALSAQGPVVLHVYDPPAGGKWIDDAIPGKVGAFDRQTGERLWVSPCEVGYGRGFGAGIGEESELVILGPSQGGHRMVRMSLDDGVLLGVESVPEFDEALVSPDLCICVGLKAITAVHTTPMVESWRVAGAGRRFHRAARAGNMLYVVYSTKDSRHQGVLAMRVDNGKLIRELVEPNQPAIHDLCAGEGVFAIVVEDLESALPPEAARDFALRQLTREDVDHDFAASGPTPGLVVHEADSGERPMWYEPLGATPAGDDLGEASVAIDSGKLYLARGALLSVRDVLTGRLLGELAVPGLDEHVAWSVKNGAFLLAEETRVSVYEIPD